MKLFLFLMSFLFSGIALSQSFEVPDKAEDPSKYVVREEIYEGRKVWVVHPRFLPYVIGREKALRYAIINGRKAAAGEFPCVFQIFGIENGSGFSCTGQLHGPEFMSTAAHCIGDENYVQANGKQIGLDCEIEPNRVDSALCQAAEAIVCEKYVNLPFDNNRVNVGEKKDSAGFGITKHDGSCGECGQKHVGEDLVVFNTFGQEYRTRNELGVVLGFGDSGGPNMRNLNDTLKDPEILDGIHSAVLVDPETDDILDVSIMVDVTESRTQAFIRNFVADRDLEACGLNSDCGVGDNPPEDCQAEAEAVIAAKEAFDAANLSFKECVKESGIFKCIPELKDAIRAKIVLLKAQRDLKKCEQGAQQNSNDL